MNLFINFAYFILGCTIPIMANILGHNIYEWVVAAYITMITLFIGLKLFVYFLELELKIYNSKKRVKTIPLLELSFTLR